jgi:hypothetical protein
MFDYLRCCYPLPDGLKDDLEYQTKDTPAQFMERYTITEEGRLVHHAVDYEDTPQAERPFPDAPDGSWRALAGRIRPVPIGDVDVPYHGSLRFYTGDSFGQLDHWWREYVALFDHGKLLKLERVKSRPLELGHPTPSEPA